IAKADDRGPAPGCFLDVSRNGNAPLADSDHQRRPWRPDLGACLGLQLRDRDAARHRWQMCKPAVAHLDRAKRKPEPFGESQHLMIVTAMRTQKHPNVR